jgi:two-component system nitrate/nitrite response regulator NarL
LQNKQIARRLNIASATVKIHIANILRALNVSSRLQAAVVAINLGVHQRWGGAQPSSTPTAVTPPRHPAILRLVPADDDASSVAGPRRDWSLEAAAG